MKSVSDERRVAHIESLVDLMSAVDALSAAVERLADELAPPIPDRSRVMATLDGLARLNAVVAGTVAHTTALVRETFDGRSQDATGAARRSSNRHTLSS